MKSMDMLFKKKADNEKRGWQEIGGLPRCGGGLMLTGGPAANRAKDWELARKHWRKNRRVPYRPEHLCMGQHVIAVEIITETIARSFGDQEPSKE